jgi:Cdc6-like AAA superfamily ATPase
MSDKSELREIEELATLISKSESRRGRESRTTRARRNPRAEASEQDDSGIKDGRMWAVYGGRNYSACEKAVEQLPPGQYTVDVNDNIGIFFRKEDINLDELMILPDSRSAEVISEIEKFWTLETKFREFGYLWKRGVMLWGPPGSGKTSTLQIISKNIVDKGGVSVYVTNPDLAARALKSLRQVEPARPIVIMLEDIDAIIDEYGESELLALMDGELQIDNVVFVATTNYPDRLDPRFVNRPSRFDIVKKIGMPSASARKAYLLAKNKRLAGWSDSTEIARWVKDTKDFSIAHIKELIISVEVFGQDLAAAATRLRKMAEKPNPSKRGGTFGFTTDGFDDET